MYVNNKKDKRKQLKMFLFLTTLAKIAKENYIFNE